MCFIIAESERAKKNQEDRRFLISLLVPEFKEEQFQIKSGQKINQNQ